MRIMRIRMEGRVVAAFALFVALALGRDARAEEKFQKLMGPQIQAKLAGVELTDEVHWDDFYQQNGVLVTGEERAAEEQGIEPAPGGRAGEAEGRALTRPTAGAGAARSAPTV
jgi:hypothetical protein